MQSFARLQHTNELLQPPLARLRFLSVLQAVENRIAVLAVERLKELLGTGPGNQCRLQVVGDGDRPLGCVRSLPAAVALCEIGRASCRERVESSVGGGSGEK